MKKYIKNTVWALIIGATLFSSGCTDSFDEINVDPDNAKEVPVGNLFSWCLWHNAARFYDRWFMLDEPATFGGYVAKMSYIDESKYQYRPGVQDSNWQYVYRSLLNLRDVQTKGLANIANAAKIMEAEVMVIATDRWRDVPYSNAGLMADGVLLPEYDTQEEIYPALLALLKSVADDMSNGFGPDKIGDYDFLFHGDMAKWQKYCNSMRLRLAIRISEVSSALAKQTIEEVLGNPAKYPIMESNSDNALFYWNGDDSNRYEPVADAYRTRKFEFCASDLMVDHMVERNDPRIGVYFTPTPSSQTPGDNDYTDGTPKYRGYVIGATTNAVTKLYSVWGQKYGIDLGGFSPFMRSAEVYFHIAEAAMLGFNTGTTAEEAYNKAVRLSMEENEVEAADIDAYLNGAGKFDNTKKKIWYEEWIAMFKQGMEGWSLYRRTGIPENHYIAPGRANKYANHNVPPFRSPYPAKTMDLNPSQNAKYAADIVDEFWGKQMWWDTRTGVY